MPKLRIENLPLNFKVRDVKILLKSWKVGEIKSDYRPGSKCETFLVDVPENSDVQKIKEALGNKKLEKKRKIAITEIKEAERKDKPFRDTQSSLRQPRPYPGKGCLKNNRSIRGTRSGNSDDAGKKFPYRFVDRKAPIRKIPPRHQQLVENRFDIALEVVWETLSPVAANPCQEMGIPDSMPKKKDNEYGGYNLRWLMVDGHIAISPFTVKSAIANGFSNLMGSCYRLVDGGTAQKAIKQQFLPCSDIENLCPRCSMFGMANSKLASGAAVGFKGRFRSSVLLGESIIGERTTRATIPVEEKGDIKNIGVEVKEWSAINGRLLGCQVLMPIQEAPKPDKRDVDGYFDKKTGELKGAKLYRHAKGQIADLEGLRQFISKINGRTDKKKGSFAYVHRLRNYAQVCETGLEFKGTLGVENANVEEAAALLLVLEHSIANHGFKIGLGKSFGLGSLRSRIRKIWIRRPADYRWTRFDMDQPAGQDRSALDLIALHLPEVRHGIDDLIKVQAVENRLNTMEGMDKISMEYPADLKTYWKWAAQHGLNE